MRVASIYLPRIQEYSSFASARKKGAIDCLNLLLGLSYVIALSKRSIYLLMILVKAFSYVITSLPLSVRSNL